MRGLLPVAALLIVACGGSDGRDSQTKPGREYVEAAVSAVNTDTASVRLGSRCMFAGWVDIIGLDALNKAGISPQNLAQGDLPALGLKISERQAREAADVFFSCFDVADLFILSEHSEKDRECIRSAIKNSDKKLREVMKEELLGSGETNLTDEIAQLLDDQCHVSIYAD